MTVISQYGAVGLQYGLSAGEPVLRHALTDPDRPDPDRILITTGSQQALDLVVRLLSPADGTPGVAVIEDPAYVGALQILRSHRYERHGFGVDADGIDTEALEAALEAGLRPQLCYINPSFQNPTGASISPQRARHLCELAETYGFVVIADDPYRELYLDGPAPPALPDSPHLIRLGSLSKVIAPGLRIGWVDAEPAIIARLELAKQAADLHTATLNQLIVAELITDQPWWRAHRDQLRTRYRHRRQLLSDAISYHLPQHHVSPQHGGFFLWLRLAEHPAGHQSHSAISESAFGPDPLLRCALEAGVAVVPGIAFSVQGHPSPTMRLSYSAGDPSGFDEAAARLATAIAKFEQAG